MSVAQWLRTRPERATMWATEYNIRRQFETPLPLASSTSISGIVGGGRGGGRNFLNGLQAHTPAKSSYTGVLNRPPVDYLPKPVG